MQGSTLHTALVLVSPPVQEEMGAWELVWVSQQVTVRDVTPPPQVLLHACQGSVRT